MNEEKLKEMAKPNKVGRAREFLQQGRKDKVYGENEYYRKGFLDGGLYADSHPKNPWISVEERLPEEFKNGFSKDVWICFRNGELIQYDFACYDYNEKCWTLLYGDYVTHWMPMPELKEK